MLVMFFFIPPRVLRGPSADRPETWPHGRKLSGLNNPSPKIRGALPQKNLGPKTCKISVDFIQLIVYSEQKGKSKYNITVN